ncbi:BON domain-containing protein [Pusillimonas caeni]|uniref:BON domain-containing protein n=1 Tax=Pusillimonas caeni TaxID=1348472 RepID=UPI001ADDB9B1|nr:BON domain-containing protein [Pusillimonas caeni]
MRNDYQRSRQPGFDRDDDYGRQSSFGQGQGGGHDYGQRGSYGRPMGARERGGFGGEEQFGRSREYGESGDYDRSEGGDYGQFGYPGQEGGYGRQMRSRERGQFGGEEQFGRGRGQGGYGDYDRNAGGNYSGYPGQGGGYDRQRQGYDRDDDFGSVGVGQPNWRNVRTPGLQGTQQERRYGMQRSMPKDYKRSDERIREDVCEHLSRSGYDVSEVSVEVSDGKVTLQGTVNDRYAKHAIEDCADDCIGVQDVDNRIRVQRDTFAGGGQPASRGNQADASSGGVQGASGGQRSST